MAYKIKIQIHQNPLRTFIAPLAIEVNCQNWTQQYGTVKMLDPNIIKSEASLGSNLGDKANRRSNKPSGRRIAALAILSRETVQTIITRVTVVENHLP